ncbi:MAG TPA: helix-turn-helix domain-containing protein [Candidatus Limnocylindria bacterium]|jgi:hypothetical protein|nr:helix-turn-helix domain-containing protein [Candidatus Limnocylindria bacterium]
MQSYEVMREVLQHTSAKQIASEMNLSLSLIYKWAEKPDADAPSASFSPLDRIEQLIQTTKDYRILNWLCQRAGGFFVRNPKPNRENPDMLMPATNEVIQEFADLLAVVAAAASDDQITKEEAKKIRTRWEGLKRTTETFVTCCENGNFQAVKNRNVPPTIGLTEAA